VVHGVRKISFLKKIVLYDLFLNFYHEEICTAVDLPEGVLTEFEVNVHGNGEKVISIIA